MISGMDINSRCLAVCTPMDGAPDDLTLIRFAAPEGDEDLAINRIYDVRNAVEQWQSKMKHYGRMTVRIEVPSINAGGGAGSASSSAIALGFTYAVWGMLSYANHHRPLLIHNATWKKELKEKLGYEGKGGIRSKEDVVFAIEEHLPGLASRIRAEFPKSFQQDVFDAVGIAYGAK